MLLTALLVALVAQGPAPSPQAAPSPTGVVPQRVAEVAPGRVWVGREQEIEQYLASAPIVRFEDVPVGVTNPRRAFFAPGGPAASIVFKPLPPGRPRGFFESYRSEIAAYVLDKLLGLGMVPPTVEKKWRHEIGSAQLWVEHCSLLKSKAGQTAPDTKRWNRQVYRQRVWDNLTANTDRNQGNLLVDDHWNLVLIDHSRCFTRISDLKYPMTKIDRPFYERLKALTEQDIKTHMRGLLLDGPKPLLKRRDAIVAHFEGMIQKYGEAAVLTD